jgi:hypothetical protein
VERLQLYLTPDEARQLRNHLDYLLENPEANEHYHLGVGDLARDLSYSIVTPRKLRELQYYTALEREILLQP